MGTSRPEEASALVCPDMGGAIAVVGTLRKFSVPLGQREHFGPLPYSLPGCSGIPNQGMGECGHLPHDLSAIKHNFVSLPESVLRSGFCSSESAHFSVHEKEGETNEGQCKEGADSNAHQHGGLGMLLHEMQPPGAQGGPQTVASLGADIFLFLHD